MLGVISARQSYICDQVEFKSLIPPEKWQKIQKF